MVYRFKIWFEEDEDIIRWIDIQPKHSFLDLHNIILDSIGFDKKQVSSFYISDDNWRKGFEITLMDMGETKEPKALMEQSKIKDFVNDPHQKFIYITDFIEMWTLNIELQSIQDDVKGVSYPLIHKSVGKAPKQNEGAGKFKIVDENEFDEIANKLISTPKPGSISDLDEHDDLVSDDDDDDSEGDEDDGYGDFYGEGVDETERF